MTTLTFVVSILCMIVGAINLAAYGYGQGHPPANLAVGIWCLAVAIWSRP